ncbi:MAG: T9SS type A sorting domain-containing protein [Bacteroidota bacterium]|nr:T9SS type A sorting domain-containing protein [Bacteroidota bacterium]
MDKNKFSTFIFYISIFLFIIAFNFSHNPPGGWYQQFMPDIGSVSIGDITFVDSLIGYSIASKFVNPDTSMIIKTTNGGNNWSIIYHQGNKRFSRIVFLNETIGYVSGGTGSGTPYLFKTTDGGIVWNNINVPGINFLDDINIISEDSIWIVDDNGFNGGIYRSTNGGINWEVQYGGGLGGNKPERIYMFNGRLGFSGKLMNNFLWRTTNSGLNWIQIQGQNGFREMYFTDSLTGWKTFPMKKTTDAGLSWVNQYTATGGYIQTSGIFDFSNVNTDTIWGVGGYVLFPNNQGRAILHRTTNGGENWYYQIPDTSIRVFPFYINFYNSKVGWAYSDAPTGIHTVLGGDSIFTNVKQVSTIIPERYFLYQNYPNPFNPITKIKFDLSKSGEVKLIIFDILGKQLSTLIDKRLISGSYEYTFDGSDLPSGVYFYSLLVEKNILTKKMLLTK